MLSLAALPWVAAQRAPAAPALLLDDGRSVDHGSLDGAAAGVGAALSGLGVGPGDRVGILCANGLGFCAAYFGALRLAAVGAPLSTASPAGELAITLADARLRVVVADVEHAALAARAISAAGTGATRLRLVDSSARARLDLSLDTLVEHPSTAPSPCPAAHPAVLLATSGTTGEPRRAVHSHAGLLFNARAVAGEMLALRPDDVQLGALSPAHSFGMSAVLNASLLAGCSMAVLRRFDAAAAAEAIRRHRVTVVQAVPTMLAALVERLPARPRSVRVCVVSGAPLPAGLAEGVHDRLCERVIERYGLTEVSPLTMRHVPRDGGEEGDVGAPLWSVVVRVADGGEEGEL